MKPVIRKANDEVQLQRLLESHKGQHQSVRLNLVALVTSNRAELPSTNLVEVLDVYNVIDVGLVLYLSKCIRNRHPCTGHRQALAVRIGHKNRNFQLSGCLKHRFFSPRPF